MVNQEVIKISLIGAGLVLVALTLMWGLIYLVVRLTNINHSQPKHKDAEGDSSDEDLECKQKAAAAALAVAIALSNTSFTSSTHVSTETLSPWQTAHRNRQIGQKPAVHQRGLKK
jgi:Na+-transporting methylmalonyl-CoA/oxaloacetate decarboxylase gamma subunit